MKRIYLYLAPLLLFGFAFVADAQDKQSDKAEGKQEVEKVNSKAEQEDQARFIDFSRQLGLSIACLTDLGEKIDAARKASDPIELAMCAKLLEAAEGVVGEEKRASLTSKALLTEAVELAKMRSVPAELVTLGKLVGGKDSKDLNTLAESVIDEQTKSGEKTRDITGDLHVDNESHDHVDIYIDGRYVGVVPGHGHQTFHVHNAYHAVARDHEGHVWRADFHHGHYHHYDWTLHPPHHGGWHPH
jgi:hypothetical protein